MSLRAWIFTLLFSAALWGIGFGLVYGVMAAVR